MLQNQEWINFNCINEPHYTKPIHLFPTIKVMNLIPWLFTLWFLEEACHLTKSPFRNYSIPDEDHEYFLNSHQTMTNAGLDKLAVYRSIFATNSMQVMKAIAFSLVPTDLSHIHLIVGHHILPKGGHQDEIKHLSCILYNSLLST